jgi:hypothetical protein
MSGFFIDPTRSTRSYTPTQISEWTKGAFQRPTVECLGVATYSIISIRRSGLNGFSTTDAILSLCMTRLNPPSCTSVSTMTGMFTSLFRICISNSNPGKSENLRSRTIQSKNWVEASSNAHSRCSATSASIPAWANAPSRYAANSTSSSISSTFSLAFIPQPPHICDPRSPPLRV